MGSINLMNRAQDACDRYFVYLEHFKLNFIISLTWKLIQLKSEVNLPRIFGKGYCQSKLILHLMPFTLKQLSFIHQGGRERERETWTIEKRITSPARKLRCWVLRYTIEARHTQSAATKYKILCGVFEFRLPERQFNCSFVKFNYSFHCKRHISWLFA